MMYRYEIDYVDELGKRHCFKWKNSCSSYATTLTMAYGHADMLGAKFGVMKIYKDDDTLDSVRWFDRVLGEGEVHPITIN